MAICAQAVYFLHSTKPNVTWLNSQWWLAACDWVMSVLSTVRKQPAWNIAENLGRFLVECTGQGNNFELIQLVRMKTRNPVGDHLVVNFWRSVIIAKFLEKWHLMVKFSKFCSKSFHCDTDRRAVFKFREIWTTRSQWNRACLLDKKKQKFAWFSSCRYCTDRAQNLPRPAPYNVLTVLQISSKSLHFRRSYSRTREHCQNAP